MSQLEVYREAKGQNDYHRLLRHSPDSLIGIMKVIAWTTYSVDTQIWYRSLLVEHLWHTSCMAAPQRGLLIKVSAYL